MIVSTNDRDVGFHHCRFIGNFHLNRILFSGEIQLPIHFRENFSVRKHFVEFDRFGELPKNLERELNCLKLPQIAEIIFAQQTVCSYAICPGFWFFSS